jgi:hypothetical protein
MSCFTDGTTPATMKVFTVWPAPRRSDTSWPIGSSVPNRLRARRSLMSAGGIVVERWSSSAEHPRPLRIGSPSVSKYAEVMMVKLTALGSSAAVAPMPDPESGLRPLRSQQHLRADGGYPENR